MIAYTVKPKTIFEGSETEFSVRYFDCSGSLAEATASSLAHFMSVVGAQPEFGKIVELRAEVASDTQVNIYDWTKGQSTNR